MTGTSLSSKEEKMVLYAIKGERSDSGGCVEALRSVRKEPLFIDLIQQKD